MLPQTISKDIKTRWCDIISVNSFRFVLSKVFFPCVKEIFVLSSGFDVIFPQISFNFVHRLCRIFIRQIFKAFSLYQWFWIFNFTYNFWRILWLLFFIFWSNHSIWTRVDNVCIFFIRIGIGSRLQRRHWLVSNWLSNFSLQMQIAPSQPALFAGNNIWASKVEAQPFSFSITFEWNNLEIEIIPNYTLH